MIPIRNIYYMLSYAFRILKEQGYKNVETEDFKNTADLFAAILSSGLASEIKRGMRREYIGMTESRSVPKGKLEIAESLKKRMPSKQQLVCSFDEFSMNSRMNRVLKSSLLLLLRSVIAPERKKRLKRLLHYFTDVEEINLRRVDWNFRYDRNNQTYRMFMAICQLLAKGLLQTRSDGSTKLMDFLDEQRMSALYERFLLAYYKREFPALNAGAYQIKWHLDDGMDEMLPAMQSDIMLSDGKTTLIIDAKYYARTTQSQYETKKLHSGNLYQIFTYVKNKAAAMKGQPHEVSGMLLYARTDEEIVPNHVYQMSGNRIAVRTLDLSADFSSIREQLDRIVITFFPALAVS